MSETPAGKAPEALGGAELESSATGSSATGGSSAPGTPRPRQRRRAFLAGAGYAALFSGVQLWQGRSAARGAAPSISASPLDGSTPAWSGGPGIVHFWATWCGVCHAMASNVRGFEAGPIWLVASRSGSAGEVRQWLGQNGSSTHGVLVDESGDASRWGVSAFPTTFFVDANGDIADASVGYTTSAGLHLRWWFGA